MFDFLVAIFPLSFYIIVFTFIPLSLLLKTLAVKKLQLTLKPALSVLFIPFSVGFFVLVQPKEKLRRLYRNLLIVYAVLAFLVFAFAIHMFF